MPVLAAASSGVGDCQGGIKRAWMKIVAQFGALSQAGKRARAQQIARCHSKRMFCMPARLDERGHRVNYDLRTS